MSFLSIYDIYISSHLLLSNTSSKALLFYDGNEINNAMATKVGRGEGAKSGKLGFTSFVNTPLGKLAKTQVFN